MPSGMRSVRAASGPYAAELSASSPKIGMPLAGPILSAFSRSEERRVGSDWSSDVCSSDLAERYEERQGGFGAICGRTQRIQSEDRDALGWTNSLGLLFFRCERAAEQQIDECHGNIHFSAAAERNGRQ